MLEMILFVELGALALAFILLLVMVGYFVYKVNSTFDDKFFEELEENKAKAESYND